MASSVKTVRKYLVFLFTTLKQKHSHLLNNQKKYRHSPPKKKKKNGGGVGGSGRKGMKKLTHRKRTAVKAV